MNDITALAQRMKAAALKATQGEWWSDVVEADGEYGDGEDRESGFHSYAVYDAQGRSLLDMTNSTAATIQTEWGHDYHSAWDVVGEHNTKHIIASQPQNVLALVEALEAKDTTIATQQQEIRTLLNAMEQATDKRNYDITGQKRLIGWRASDYTDETSDPELAKNWAAAIGVLPIFEGDVNTKLSTAGIGVKGE